MGRVGTRWWKLRRRYGIAAPQVEVSSRIAWYWRAVGVAVLLGIASAAAAWFFDAGRRSAGFDSTRAENDLERLKEQLASTRAELARVQAIANAGDARLAMERTAEEKLAQQVRALEQENANVREELGTLESLLSSGERNTQRVSIYRFRVEPQSLPGEYRYRLLLATPTSRSEREFNGRLELVVALQQAGRDVMMTIPEKKDANAAFRLSFKYFRRIEGTFSVGSDATLKSVQARVYEGSATEPRATSSASP